MTSGLRGPQHRRMINVIRCISYAHFVHESSLQRLQQETRWEISACFAHNPIQLALQFSRRESESDERQQ